MGGRTFGSRIQHHATRPLKHANGSLPISTDTIAPTFGHPAPLTLILRITLCEAQLSGTEAGAGGHQRGGGVLLIKNAANMKLSNLSRIPCTAGHSSRSSITPAG
ncbi:uncharacterized protein LOC121601680 [Anopheles merus]|uniref:uncharacterized protein LOC121601680 n=1 Tax=Anopheles merus TaxID=30066 RepID=UPI001BE47386|nr:uncharacterized protein LOC121601680 [Anopheles merus]